MREILEMLYDKVEEKLNDEGVSIEAKEILTQFKDELEKMKKKTFTIDDADEINKALEKFKELLKGVKDV